MTADTGLSKEDEEEEDDTMQNTVVLFSNTDKFVLLQVKNGNFVVWCMFMTLGWQFHMPFFLCFLGHVCSMWQFWTRSRGPVVSLCSVLPVLPSILCKQQGKHVITDVISAAGCSNVEN